MNVEIGAEAAQFPEKEYINGIVVAVHAATPFAIQKFHLPSLIKNAFLGYGQLLQEIPAQHCLLLDTVYGCRNLERGRTSFIVGDICFEFSVQCRVACRELKQGPTTRYLIVY
jgi:hypothetical protein